MHRQAGGVPSAPATSFASQHVADSSGRAARPPLLSFYRPHSHSTVIHSPKAASVLYQAYSIGPHLAALRSSPTVLSRVPDSTPSLLSAHGDMYAHLRSFPNLCSFTVSGARLRSNTYVVLYHSHRIAFCIVSNHTRMGRCKCAAGIFSNLSFSRDLCVVRNNPCPREVVLQTTGRGLFSAERNKLTFCMRICTDDMRPPHVVAQVLRYLTAARTAKE